VRARPRRSVGASSRPRRRRRSSPRAWPGDAIVSDVARRHGLSPQRLFGWRARLRDAVKGSGPSSDAAPAFLPAIVGNEPPCPAVSALPATAAAMGTAVPTWHRSRSRSAGSSCA
jgi:transposase